MTPIKPVSGHADLNKLAIRQRLADFVALDVNPELSHGNIY
jgi:hypothetical protein